MSWRPAEAPPRLACGACSPVPQDRIEVEPCGGPVEATVAGGTGARMCRRTDSGTPCCNSCGKEFLTAGALIGNHMCRPAGRHHFSESEEVAYRGRRICRRRAVCHGRWFLLWRRDLEPEQKGLRESRKGNDDDRPERRERERAREREREKSTRDRRGFRGDPSF